MLSGNEHSHNERLIADDADGKADVFVARKRVELQKCPMVDEIFGNGAKCCIFFQDTVLQHVGREEGITDPISFAGRGKNYAQNIVGAVRTAIFGIFGQGLDRFVDVAAGVLRKIQKYGRSGRVTALYKIVGALEAVEILLIQGGEQLLLSLGGVF